MNYYEHQKNEIQKQIKALQALKNICCEIIDKENKMANFDFDMTLPHIVEMFGENAELGDFDGNDYDWFPGFAELRDKVCDLRNEYAVRYQKLQTI